MSEKQNQDENINFDDKIDVTLKSVSQHRKQQAQGKDVYDEVAFLGLKKAGQYESKVEDEEKTIAYE